MSISTISKPQQRPYVTQSITKFGLQSQPIPNQPRFGMGWDSFTKRVGRDVNHAMAPEAHRERYITFNQGKYANADALYAAYSDYEEKVQQSQAHLLAGGAFGGGIGALLGHALDNLDIDSDDENADARSQKSNDSGPGLFATLGGLIGAGLGAFTQHEIAEEAGADYGLDEYEQSIAESVGHAGEMLSQRLATDPALQKSFEKMVRVAQNGGLTEENLTELADEYVKNEKKQLGQDGSVRFGARRDPALVRHGLGVGTLAFFSLANGLAAVPGYIGHGLETPAHMVVTAVMQSTLNKIYTGPSEKDRLRSKIMNGPYSLVGNGIGLVETGTSIAMRFGTTATTAIHLGAGHVVMVPTVAFMKGASTFLAGGMMIPVHNNFGQALNDEEDSSSSAYKKIDAHAQEYLDNHKNWTHHFYSGRVKEASKYHSAREAAATKIQQADYGKLGGFQKWCFDQSLLRSTDDLKRILVTDVFAAKDSIASLFSGNKQQLKEHYE
jgi:hypothetical protein